MIYAAGAFWLIIGGTVLLVVVRGQQGGAGATPPGQSRLARRMGTFFIVLTIVLGLTIPIFILVNNGDNHASIGPDGIKLTANETTGRELFAKACATCHTLSAAKAVGRVGPDLDVLRPQEALILDAIANGRAQGRGQMPALLYTGQDATDVAEFVATVAGR